MAALVVGGMLALWVRVIFVCYLETNKPQNVDIYRHFAFRLEEQALIPGSDVMHYAMTRTPVPPISAEEGAQAE